MTPADLPVTPVRAYKTAISSSKHERAALSKCLLGKGASPGRRQSSLSTGNHLTLAMLVFVAAGRSYVCSLVGTQSRLVLTLNHLIPIIDQYTGITSEMPLQAEERVGDENSSFLNLFKKSNSKIM